MTEFINKLFSTIFGDNVILATILIAIVPIIELRGAIPFGTNSGFWKEHTLTNWQAFGWSLLGSSLVVFVLALIFKPVINMLKRIKVFNKIATALENRVKDKASNIEGANIKSKRFSKSYWKKILAVFAFVAIPLPLTGVWTGTCMAVFIGLDYWSTCVSVISGNIIAGLLITLMLQFFPWLNNWLFYIFLIIIVAILLYELIKFLINKSKKKTIASKQENSTNNQQ